MLTYSVLQTAQGKQLNAAFTQGDVVGWAFAGSIDGAPINLTGSSIKMTIKFATTSLVLSTGNGGITITDAALGEFTVNMSSTVTAALAIGTWKYDLWIETQLSPPIETQYITGTMTINQSITSVP